MIGVGGDRALFTVVRWVSMGGGEGVESYIIIWVCAACSVFGVPSLYVWARVGKWVAGGAPISVPMRCVQWVVLLELRSSAFRPSAIGNSDTSSTFQSSYSVTGAGVKP